jgi:IMP dehydrogenase
VLYVEENATVADAERLMHQYSIGGVPVVDKGKIIGIVSRRDVRAIVSRRGEENICSIMTKKPIVADETITAEKALEIMYTNKVERLPVVDTKGKLLGIITMQDILEKRQYPLATRDAKGNLRVAAAVGPFDFARAELLDQNGVDALVVDCAHGHNMKVVAGVQDIKESVKEDVIAGNIATSEAAEALVGAGVDGIKVGIGPGSICTTRIVAGVGVPQITAIAQVADVASRAGIPIIADGGVRYSGDVAKAIAAGADTVMMGSMFAGTDEAPGKVITIKGRRYKQYRGMGSLGVMSGGQSSDRYFQKKDIGSTKFVPEGVEGVTPYVGHVSEVMYQLVGGLKAAMGYTGSKTIPEMHTKAKFVRITNAGMTESHPHNILITDEAPNYRLFE